MNFREKIERFKRIALVGYTTSIYNEDSMTATELTWENTRKVRECMQVTAELCDMVSALIDSVNLEYSEEQQEINLSLKARFEEIKTESINCFINPFHENSMSALELAGENSAHINECVRLINKMSATLVDFVDNLGLEYDETNKEITIKTGGVI